MYHIVLDQCYGCVYRVVDGEETEISETTCAAPQPGDGTEQINCNGDCFVSIIADYTII